MRVLADANRTSALRPLLASALLLAALLPRALAAAGEQAADTRRESGLPRPCPSLEDGQGRHVQGHGEAASVGTAFAKRCPQRVPRVVPRAVPPKTGVPGLSKTVTPVRPEASAPALALRVETQRENTAHSGAAGTIGRITATLLTSGVVVWMLHSSLLASLLVLGVPLWRHVDLLPIVESGIRPEPDPGASQEEHALPGVLGARASHR